MNKIIMHAMPMWQCQHQRWVFCRTDGTCKSKNSSHFILPHCCLASMLSNKRHTVIESEHYVLFLKDLSIGTGVKNRIQIRIDELLWMDMYMARCNINSNLKGKGD